MKPYTMCKFEAPIGMWNEYPFSKHDRFVFLSEINNMEGHCVVVNWKTGQVLSGYHTDDFVELTEEEL